MLGGCFSCPSERRQECEGRRCGRDRSGEAGEGEGDVEEGTQVYSLSDYVELKPFVYQKLRVKEGGNGFGRKIMS